MVRFVFEPSFKIPSRDNEAYHLWGVTFPAGVPVEVTDARLAHKCRCLVELREIIDTEANATTQPAPVPSIAETLPAMEVLEEHPAEVPAGSAHVPAGSSESPPKRGRGRPRKVQPQ